MHPPGPWQALRKCLPIWGGSGAPRWSQLGRGSQLHPRDPIPRQGWTVEVTLTWDAGRVRRGWELLETQPQRKSLPMQGPGNNKKPLLEITISGTIKIEHLMIYMFSSLNFHPP